jgi:hypothetical protein
MPFFNAQPSHGAVCVQLYRNVVLTSAFIQQVSAFCSLWRKQLAANIPDSHHQLLQAVCMQHLSKEGKTLQNTSMLKLPAVVSKVFQQAVSTVRWFIGSQNGADAWACAMEEAYDYALLFFMVDYPHGGSSQEMKGYFLERSLLLKPSHLSVRGIGRSLRRLRPHGRPSLEQG